MPDLISDMKLDSLVNVEKEEVVSLIELLLGNQATTYNKEKERARNTSTPGVKVKSRKDRRRSGRSAKTRNKQKSKTGSSVQKMEQLRVANIRQEKRKQALLKYQTQKGQKKTSPTSDQAGDAASSKRADTKRAEKEANSIEINPAMRPVILALIDFKPVFDSESNVTAVGNTIKAKRAARALRVENLLDIDTSEELIGELDWLAAHVSNLAAQQSFLDSLDATNIEMYEEALSAFELDSASVSSASNTEVLYTLIRDYCYSLTSCTPRLLELSTREFEAGSKLVKWEGDPNYVRRSLSFSTAIGGLYDRLPEDSEIGLRQLLATISRELLLSYNKQQNNIDDADAEIYPKGQGKAYQGYGFCSYLNVYPGTSKFQPLTKGVSESDAFGTFNMNGLLYPSVVNGQKVAVYPFEKSELITSSRYKSTDSAPDEVKKIYAAQEPEAGLAPYSEISSRWTDAKTTIEDLLDTEMLGLDGSPGSEVLEVICRNIVLKCLEALPESSASSAGVSDALQIAWLCAAGRDSEAWQWLFLYLAFLQDQVSGVAITGEQTNLAALSWVVRNDSTLIQLIGKPSSSTSKTQFFSVPESTISVTPKPDDWSNPTTIDPMSVKQKTELAEGESSENSSLQSYFDLTWEEVCELCAMGMRAKLSTTTNSTEDELSDKTTAKVDDFKEALMALSTTSDSIFLSLLELLNDAVFLFGNNCIDDLELTNYSQFPANRLHGFIIQAAAKTASFYIDDLTSTSGAMSSVFESSASDIIASSVSKVSSGGGLKIMGPRMAASWSSSAESGTSIAGLNMTFQYAGVADRKSALETFLDSEEQDATLLEEQSSALSRTFSALDENYEFISGFIESLDSYFSNVRDTFSAIVDVIVADIDEETEGTQTLIDRIREGLPLSTDMCKMLLNYIRVYDSSDSTYQDIRTRDKALVCSNVAFMSSILQEEDFCEPDKLKYMVVGIPAGCLDMTKEDPVDLEEVDREITTPSRNNFSVSIEKVDLTRPELEYEDKEYLFSRNLFINQIDDSTEGEIIVNFDSIDKDFSVTEQAESGLSSETYSDEQVNNLKNDFALKLYSDLFLDLDFFEDAYPNGSSQRRDVLTGSISLPSLDGVDKDANAFLSGSNIAFDTDDRKIEGFTFYSEGSEMLNMDLFKDLDPVAFSVYSYLNSYGTVANASAKKDSLKYGTIFERVVAIPFDPTSFEVEISTEDETSAETNAKNEKLTEAETEVGIGLETSQGVEMANYRVYVTIPDTGSEETTSE